MTVRLPSGDGLIRRRRAGIAIAAGALLTFTSLAAASSADSATVAATPASDDSPPTPTPPPASPLPPGGLLTLTTASGNASSGAVTYSVGGIDTVQTLTGGANCLLQTTPTLLGIFGSPPPPFTNTTTNSASLKTGSIGVAEKSSGVSCSRVGKTATVTESLKLDITVGRPSGAKQPVATSGFLDVEMKGTGARVQAVTYLRGIQTGVFEVQTGSTVFPPSVVGTQTAVVTRCSASSDSGSDDHESDNCHWPISAPSWLTAPDDGIAFDSITLKPLSGSFSLEGGSDGLVAPLPPVNFPQRGSIFELADGILSCDETTTLLPADGTAPQVSVKRLQNVAGGPLCTPISYSLSHTANTVTFLKPLALQTNAQFIVSVVWSNPVPAGPATLTATTADFQAGTGPVPLGWCPDPLFSGTTLIGIADPAGQDETPFDPDGLLPGLQYACIGSSASSVVPGVPNTLQVTEQIYLEGDITFNRGG